MTIRDAIEILYEEATNEERTHTLEEINEAKELLTSTNSKILNGTIMLLKSERRSDNMPKAEREFRKIMKDKFFDWQDASDENYRAICCSNYCVCEDIAKQAFGWTERQVELNESRWRKEYRAIYEK